MMLMLMVLVVMLMPVTVIETETLMDHGLLVAAVGGENVGVAVLTTVTV